MDALVLGSSPMTTLIADYEMQHAEAISIDMAGLLNQQVINSSLLGEPGLHEPSEHAIYMHTGFLGACCPASMMLAAQQSYPSTQADQDPEDQSPNAAELLGDERHRTAKTGQVTAAADLGRGQGYKLGEGLHEQMFVVNKPSSQPCCTLHHNLLPQLNGEGGEWAFLHCLAAHSLMRLQVPESAMATSTYSHGKHLEYTKHWHPECGRHA